MAGIVALLTAFPPSPGAKLAGCVVGSVIAIAAGIVITAITQGRRKGRKR
jgi:hypothetical protein